MNVVWSQVVLRDGIPFSVEKVVGDDVTYVGRVVVHLNGDSGKKYSVSSRFAPSWDMIQEAERANANPPSDESWRARSGRFLTEPTGPPK